MKARFREPGPVMVCACSLLAVFLCQPDSGAGDWPNWRGPEWDGIARETAWNPGKLSGTLPVLWQYNAGAGYSAVSVQGAIACTMGNINGKDIVYALDKMTGRELWRYEYDARAGSYPGPRATPAIDGDHIYTIGREGHVLCLDKKGKCVWDRNIIRDLNARNITWGITSSPRIHGNLLLINALSHGIALDKRTGEAVWTSDPGLGSYAVPVIYEAGGSEYAAIFSQKAIFGVSLADGMAKWSFGWMTSHDVNAPDPLVFGGKVFITSGYKRGCALLDISGDQAKCLWENTNMRAQFSSPVYFGGYIYGADGNVGSGSLRCLDPADGRIVWEHETGFCSLIVVNDKLVVLNERGMILVVDAVHSGYKEIARNQLPGIKATKCWTAPVMSDGLLFCRDSGGQVFCIDLR